MKLYVGNLPFSATEAELKETFGAFGAVDSVSLISDRETGRAKGFGFVEMGNANEAKAAIEALNGKNMGARAMVVNEARPREDRPARGGFGGDRGGFGGDRGGNRGGNRW